jgi:hypothetical protein
MASLLLSEMVLDLRAEAGHSLLLGQGTNMEDTLKYYLRRTQRELYTGFDWPQFMIYETVAVPAGSRHLPGFLNIIDEQINTLWTLSGSSWVPLIFGIDPLDYSARDPTADVRTTRIERYRYDALASALEIWPLPQEDTQVMGLGQIKLPPLIADSDTSLLDGQLIVMFAAANILARQKSEDAGLVLQKAQQLLVSIQKQNGSQKRPAVSMAAAASGGRRPMGHVSAIVPRP